MSHIYLDEIHEFLELNLESTEIESLCCVKSIQKVAILMTVAEYSDLGKKF